MLDTQENNSFQQFSLSLRAVPGLLGSKTHFKTEFSEPVELGQRHTATKRELATGRKAMTRLAQKLSGYFLRRTKALISDQLPKKEDRVSSIYYLGLFLLLWILYNYIVGMLEYPAYGIAHV